MMQALISIGRAAALLGVSVVTLRRWDKLGILKSQSRTFGGHRRYHLPEVKAMRGDTVKQQVVGYARVSSHDQKADLVRQAQRLRAAGCDTVLSDLGSGLNCKKPRLKKLLELITNGEISTLMLSHKDRLLRFGHELVFHLCRLFGVHVVILEETAQDSFEVELTKDVITLMTVFSARLYGRRSHQKKRHTAR